jgi:Putative DNA-binding domain
MNFDKMTTDELKELMPSNENRWEYKDAALLLNENRNELLAELAKQTSAFANSGGGFLVIGVKKEDLSFQACELVYLTRRNQRGEPMEEWLSKQIQIAVEYPLFGAKVYRINFTNDSNKAVFVVEYPDSPKAPHQSTKDLKYYWRTNFTSEPAPHYFLDALRSRPSKATVELHLNDFMLALDNEITHTVTLRIWLQVLVINTSFVSTDGWCVHAECADSEVEWKLIDENAAEGSVRPKFEKDKQILPAEKRSQWLDFRASLDKTIWNRLDIEMKFNAFTGFQVGLKPASHNFVGNPVMFCLSQDEETSRKAKMQFIDLSK